MHQLGLQTEGQKKGQRQESDDGVESAALALGALGVMCDVTSAAAPTTPS